MKQAEHPIPVAANLLVGAGLIVGIPASLWAIEHSAAAPLALLLFFALGQTLFALLHEAEHDKLFPNPTVNALTGAVLGALFGGSFAILRAGHLVHHGRNRTEAELIDYVRPEENRLSKALKYYAMMGGAIWIGIPVLSLVACILPTRLFALSPDQPRRTDLGTYIAFLAHARRGQVRLETAFTIVAWVAAAALLDLGWRTFVAYLLFGILWSSQQYIYHVGTKLDVVDGSYDLAVSAPVRWLLLNGNYHWTHHRFPHAPWTALPALAPAPPTRSYLLTWVGLLRPPRPIAEAIR